MSKPALSSGPTQVIWRRPIHLRVRERLMRRFGVFGKDLAQFARVALAILVLLTIILVARLALEQFNGPAVTAEALADLVAIGILLMSFALGLGITGEEEENETQRFLGRLPAHPLSLLSAKLFAGLILLFLWIACMLLAIAAILPHHRTVPFLEELASRFGPRASNAQSVLPFALSLYLTGLAAGMWFRGRLMAGAFISAGLKFLFGILFLAVVALAKQEQKLGTSLLWTLDHEGYTNLAHHLWSILMFAALLLGGRTIDEGAPPWWEKLANRKREKAIVTQGTRAPLRLNPARAIPAWATLYSLLGLVILHLVLGMMDSTSGHLSLPTTVMTVAVIAASAGAFLGGVSLHRNERELADGFVYTLPVSVARFHLTRMKTLFPAALLGGGLLSIPCFAPGLDGQPLHVGAGAVASAMGAFLGYWMRLHLRSVLTATILSIPLVAVWAAMLALRYSLGAFDSDSANIDLPRLVSLTFWPSFAALGASFGMVMLAVRGSLLLEMNEAPRGAAMMLGVLLALVWGPFLIGVSVVDLWHICFG